MERSNHNLPPSRDQIWRDMVTIEGGDPSIREGEGFAIGGEGRGGEGGEGRRKGVVTGVGSSGGVRCKTVNATCHASEKQALMDFKKDLKDPYGRLSSWIHDVDCCKWKGVVCSNRSGRVIQLHLQSPANDEVFADPKSPLSGNISHSLQNLTHLCYLDLSLNNFSGIPIPSFFGSLRSLSSSLPSEVFTLKDLISLDTSNNHLNGPIPSTIGNCTKLKQLFLNHNALSGSIPSNLGKLSSLENWDVSHNKLTGTLPESLWQLSKLEVLCIYNNLMEGIVSESQLDNLTSLTFFDPSENSFTLKVSANWTPRAQFNILGLSSWKLGPQFPTWIQSQKILRNLNLSFTGISDTIPTWLFNPSLDSVDLSRNQLHDKSSMISEIVKGLYVHSSQTYSMAYSH
ncbi:receptor-like protein EIX2 [Coffea eugenioides]|uniref:receptor-like protein EIX2 n=1 Tax=Coffea eugenioides TaxID=49369 RepID=UPI000F6054A9|nr:receptor-like protein EIX2 [Coffea eugenioides]